tara:strand:+ start:101 stop:283 length:183 start_codon:yes stop_codon:yes gene_type:complete
MRQRKYIKNQSRQTQYAHESAEHQLWESDGNVYSRKINDIYMLFLLDIDNVVIGLSLKKN